MRLFLILLPFFLTPVTGLAEVHSLWFNSGMNNRDITFSPDGKVMLTTILAPKNVSAAIAISHLQNGDWSPLEIAPFSGVHMDIEAAFSPDGKMVYFASKRPKPDREGSDWDLWQVPYDDGKWGKPVNLGAPVNSPGNEFYPSVAANGNLYFTATREDGAGGEDIYRALPDEGGYPTVENIGAPVNSPGFEFNAFIAPDESYLLFGSQGREGETGGGDIFISYRKAGTFTEPRLLPASVNTHRLDYCPTVFRDRLYFTSERLGDIDLATMEKLLRFHDSPANGLGDVYWISMDEIHD
jgi:Tol biopolymer transport system component